GPKQTFRSKAAAENFVRHLTRELTAGGIGHWVELREDAAQQRWTPVVHVSSCKGGASCDCVSPA
ncbi:MAG TPA: hypothetical protein VMF89_17765, partial [Polyangiales bacterium]|nr:hypothetical protein [Polyangiales bacterium]